MEYRLPTLEDREELLAYFDECRDNNEQNVLLHQDLFEKDYPAWCRTFPVQALRASLLGSPSLIALW